MTARPVTDEIAAVMDLSPEQLLERAITDTRQQHEAVSDISAEWGMVLVEEIERLREQVPTEGRDPEARRVVRAMLAGLLMTRAPGGADEFAAKRAVEGTDALLAELERTEAHAS
jgi:hypothetical protein